MFGFLGLRKDSKKSTTEKEADGGFVMIGETLEEQRRRTKNISQPATNVIVLPSKPPAPPPAPPAAHTPAPPVPEAASPVPDLLGDVPFTLAPHIRAVQMGLRLLPDVSRDVSSNLSSYQYDFSLENSVLLNA